MELFFLLTFSPSVSLRVFFLPRCVPQKVTGQQREINNLVERGTEEDDENALMKKELTVLREQLVNKTQELKVGGTNFLWQSGPQSRKVSFLCGTEQDKSSAVVATGV